ncbi:MAG: organic hydroperoxide resistance protein, partial [Pseudomonadota bacterium]
DGQGTNPEQLFAAGYAACFIGALKLVAGQAKIKLPADTHINSEVSIGPIEGGFGIAVKLAVSVGDLDKDTALALVNKAHEVCPYSNATRGNIAVELSVI